MGLSCKELKAMETPADCPNDRHVINPMCGTGVQPDHHHNTTNTVN